MNRNLIKIFTLMISVLALNGCTTIETPVATNGSRADGTVTLSYEYGSFETPDVQWDVADKEAIEKCQAWNYKSAERFGGSEESCVAENAYGDCLRTRVNTVYQCTQKK